MKNMILKEIISKLETIKNDVNQLICSVNYWDYAIVSDLENVIKELQDMINSLEQGEQND